MHGRVDDNDAEERGFELLSFLEPFAGWLAFPSTRGRMTAK
jgi:hypothetical protein